MKVETLGAALIATGLVVVSPAYGQEECPVGRPEILVRGIAQVTGGRPPVGRRGQWHHQLDRAERGGDGALGSRLRGFGPGLALVHNSRSRSIIALHPEIRGPA